MGDGGVTLDTAPPFRVLGPGTHPPHGKEGLYTSQKESGS